MQVSPAASRYLLGQCSGPLCTAAGAGGQGACNANAILDPCRRPSRAKTHGAQRQGLQVCTLRFQPLQELDLSHSDGLEPQTDFAQVACSAAGPWHFTPSCCACQHHLAAREGHTSRCRAQGTLPHSAGDCKASCFAGCIAWMIFRSQRSPPLDMQWRWKGQGASSHGG